MPYAIRQQAEHDWVVVKRDTGKVVSHHKTRSKAVKAIRAMYASERKSEHRWFR